MRHCESEGKGKGTESKTEILRLRKELAEDTYFQVGILYSSSPAISSENSNGKQLSPVTRAN